MAWQRSRRSTAVVGFGQSWAAWAAVAAVAQFLATKKWCIIVTFVAGASSTRVTSRCIWEPTLGRNHSNVNIVPKLSDRRHIYSNTCLFTKEYPETEIIYARQITLIYEMETSYLPGKLNLFGKKTFKWYQLDVTNNPKTKHF